MIMVPLYLCQLNSLIELFEKFKSKSNIDDHILKGMNYNVIRYMNEFDELTQSFRHLFFFFFVIVSFIADTAVFIGAVVQLSSSVISNIMAFIGFIGLVLIAMVAYVAGAFLAQVIRKKQTSKCYFNISYLRV